MHISESSVRKIRYYINKHFPHLNVRRIDNCIQIEDRPWRPVFQVNLLSREDMSYFRVIGVPADRFVERVVKILLDGHPQVRGFWLLYSNETEYYANVLRTIGKHNVKIENIGESQWPLCRIYWEEAINQSVLAAFI